MQSLSLQHRPQSSSSQQLCITKPSNLFIRPGDIIAAKEKEAQVLTILNSINHDYVVPYRHMGWNMFDTIRTSSPFVFRINDGESNNTLLQKVCQERGWREFKDIFKEKMSRAERELFENSNWNLWWSYNFYQGSPYRTLKCWQFTNHNPRAFQFCSKPYLTCFLRKMTSEFGEIYNFGPKSFIMPEDYIRFVMEHSKRQEKDCPEAKNIVGSELLLNLSDGDKASLNEKPKKELRHPVWILKPVGKSQGKGIVLTKDIGLVASAHRCVVQEYISRPLLIGGYKWDLRIYTCITSTDPLTIYIYREGLCRFATEKFDLSNLSACYSHLTNASLNKLGPDYPTNKDVVGSGCKWSLKQLRAHFRKEKRKDWLLWQKIMSLVLLTVVGEGLKAGGSFPTNRNCFDFFGFDILVDSDFEPWLLEVNYSPGLGGDCEVDEIVKKPMLHQLFNLLGFPNASTRVKRRPSSASSGTSSQRTPPPSATSEVKEKKVKISKRKLQIAQDSVNVDVSCKARLKEASLIYSQDLVLEYFGNHCKNPNFQMSRSMKYLYEKKLAEAKKKHKFEKLMKKLKQEEENNTKLLSISEPKLEIITESSENEGSLGTLDLNNNLIGSEVSEIDLESRPSSCDSSARPSTCDSSITFSEKSRDSAGEDKEEGSTPSAPSIPLSPGHITIQRQDWTNPPRNGGDWCLVYPCKAFPYRSPYRSALADLRNIVKGVENYLKVAKSIVKLYPNENDSFYESKIKVLCQWSIDIWTPPKVDEEENIIPILRH